MSARTGPVATIELPPGVTRLDIAGAMIELARQALVAPEPDVAGALGSLHAAQACLEAAKKGARTRLRGGG